MNTKENVFSEYYKVIIDEYGRKSLKDDSHIFNTINERFGYISDIKKFFIDRYGRVPNGRNKIYVDTPRGTVEIGFTYSFWNSDTSHDISSWYQTDWIIMSHVSELSFSILDQEDRKF